MERQNKYISNDFYIALFDEDGNLVYPNDQESIKRITFLLKSFNNTEIINIPEEKAWYEIKQKDKTINGIRLIEVTINNVTGYMNEIEKLSFDEVTHLNTRRIARNLFMEYIEYAHENEENFAVLMCDLDYLKQINDRYGHLAGDKSLLRVSQALHKYTRHGDEDREEDIVARLGGDEFIVIFKNISRDFAERRAEQLKREMEKYKITEVDTESQEVLVFGTMSIGLYYLTSQEINNFYERGYTVDEIRKTILERCDTALYNSKETRNSVSSYSRYRSKELTKRDKF